MKELFSRSDILKSQSGTREDEIIAQIDDNTGSDVNLELAKIWLQKCLLHHDKCAVYQLRKTQSALPSRLIDVFDPEKPYVLEIEDHHDDYLTLSYCWGHGKRLLNTAQSKESFQQGLPMDDRMPLTFREAFKVTKTLGCRYIWIDALCIIQDDPLDLVKEMTKMGDIYRNSIITIFAGNGTSVQSGLFACRDGPTYKPCNVSIRTRERDVFERKEVSFYSTRYAFDNPLSRRAWILQEEAFAQRQLIFTPREIRWTCKTQTLRESAPQTPAGPETWEPYTNSSALRPIHSLLASLSVADTTAEASPGSRRHFHVWYQTVAAYSPRNLTVASDKLPAISAIARSIQSHFGCEYGAGLFKEDLSVGLCWTTDRVMVDFEEPSCSLNNVTQESKQEYVAPSWSWASLRDTSLIWKASYDKGEAPEEGIEVLDWHFSYAPGAMIPFGQITSGVLKLRGYLRKELLVPHLEEAKWPRLERRIWGAQTVDPDPSVATIIGLVALDTPSFYLDLKKRFSDLDCTPEGFRASPHEFVSRALPVFSLVTYVIKESKHRSVLSQVLVPHDLAKHEYRRIGLLMVAYEPNSQWDSWTTISPRQTIKIV